MLESNVHSLFIVNQYSCINFDQKMLLLNCVKLKLNHFYFVKKMVTYLIQRFPLFSSIIGKQSKLLVLPAIFRLVSLCEAQQNNGNLEGIDALLGKHKIVIYILYVTKKYPLPWLKNRFSTPYCFNRILFL